MTKTKEIQEVKSLRWLANMFPLTIPPKDEADKMANAIHAYCTAGADQIEALQQELDNLQNKGEKS